MKLWEPNNRHGRRKKVARQPFKHKQPLPKGHRWKKKNGFWNEFYYCSVCNQSVLPIKIFSKSNIRLWVAQSNSWDWTRVPGTRLRTRYAYPVSCKEFVMNEALV